MTINKTWDPLNEKKMNGDPSPCTPKIASKKIIYILGLKFKSFSYVVFGSPHLTCILGHDYLLCNVII